MIKHRFILRGEDDFRIFAAIPVERTVLTWKKWIKPTDWNAVRTLIGELIHGAHAIESMYGSIRSKLQTLNDNTVPEAYILAGIAIEQSVSKARIEQFVVDNAEQIAEAENEERRWSAFVEGWQRLAFSLDNYDPSSKSENVSQETLDSAIDTVLKSAVISCANGKNHCDVLDDFRRQFNAALRDCIAAEVESIKYKANQFAASLREQQHCFRTLLACLTVDNVRAKYRRLATEAQQLVSTSSTIEPSCPSGIPFACYTVEFHGGVVSIIEGNAWLQDNLRVLTEDEKRVVEIISQMLTERSLNPKADTRIPVVSTDPAHERDVRAAEDRDKRSPVHETRLRTIKFTVSPPRYLRAAAERILSSPRKAHWVVGHWRDQAYGTAHQLRRSTWIKPHIRGLGEAGAITARIAAPDEKTGN